MTQNKHTKAPWFVGHRLNSHETRICTIVGGEAIHGSEAAVTEWLHDANLIAEAPVLLGIAQRLIALESQWHPERYESEKAELISDARVAIAKVVGEQL